MISATKFALSAIALIGGEFVVAFVFHVLRRKVGPNLDDGGVRFAVPKGVLERAVITTGLLAGFPHVLTVFGALKIGTRLSRDQDDHISNTYFLTGNLVSVLVAMLYAIALRSIW